MNVCGRSIIVKGGTKFLQMDKLFPRGVHGSLTTTITLSSSPPARHCCASFGALPASAYFITLSRPSPFSPLSRITDFYHSFPKARSKFSESTMGENPPGMEEAKKDQQSRGYDKASGDYSNRGADDILPHILNIYGSRASPQDFEIYAPNATFEDPLMRAEGIKQIKSSFYSLAKVFSESGIVEYSINEDVISPRKKEISIDNKQYYKIWGKDIHIISLMKLQVENGKIVRHEDWWDKKPLWNRETVKLPLIGRMTEMTRRASMLVTHVLMGFGKDPSST